MKKTTSSAVKRPGKGSRAAMVVAKPTTLVAAKATAKSIQKKPLRQQVVARPGKAARSPSGVTSLTSAQLKDLDAKLHRLSRELSEAIAAKTFQFNAVETTESLIKGDDAEVAEKQRTNNAALQELDILKHRLILVKRGIAKIKAGVYGICEETEEPIGFERLNIVPWARYSIHVQEIRERKHREFRRSKLHAEL